jgi:hypothetical protein
LRTLQDHEGKRNLTLDLIFSPASRASKTAAWVEMLSSNSRLPQSHVEYA